MPTAPIIFLFASLFFVITAPKNEPLLLDGTGFAKSGQNTFSTTEAFEKELLPETIEKFGKPQIVVAIKDGKMADVSLICKQKPPALVQEVLDEFKGKTLSQNSLKELCEAVQLMLNWELSPKEAVEKVAQGLNLIILKSLKNRILVMSEFKFFNPNAQPMGLSISINLGVVNGIVNDYSITISRQQQPPVEYLEKFKVFYKEHFVKRRISRNIFEKFLLETTKIVK
jgi:hypothetical protein